MRSLTRPKNMPNAHLPPSARKNPPIKNMAFLGDENKNEFFGEVMDSSKVAALLPLIHQINMNISKKNSENKHNRVKSEAG
jgi:hypothetical protein